MTRDSNSKMNINLNEIVMTNTLIPMNKMKTEIHCIRLNCGHVDQTMEKHTKIRVSTDKIASLTLN